MRKKASSPTEVVLDLLLTLYESPRGSGDLADGVSQLRGREVPLATYYRQLQKAVDESWVEFQEPGAERSGPGRPERLYRLTEEGERVLRFGLEYQKRRVEQAEALGLLAGRAR